jgi:hypothetical protein
MLGELLSTLANQTDAFEFEVQYVEEGKAETGSK